MKLEDFSVTEIRKIVSNYNKQVKIAGYSKLPKADLIKKLREHPALTITEGGEKIKIKVNKEIDAEKAPPKEKKAPAPKKEKPKPAPAKPKPAPKKEKPKPAPKKEKPKPAPAKNDEETPKPEKKENAIPKEAVTFIKASRELLGDKLFMRMYENTVKGKINKRRYDIINDIFYQYVGMPLFVNLNINKDIADIMDNAKPLSELEKVYAENTHKESWKEQLTTKNFKDAVNSLIQQISNSRKGNLELSPLKEVKEFNKKYGSSDYFDIETLPELNKFMNNLKEEGDKVKDMVKKVDDREELFIKTQEHLKQKFNIVHTPKKTFNIDSSISQRK